MAHQRGAALWQFSCLTLIVASVLACAVVSIGGRSVGLPVVAIWLIVAMFALVTMVGSLRLARGESARVESVEEMPTAPAAPGARFDDWLTELMAERDINVTRLALDLDVREDVIEDWMAGRKAPTPVECARLAQLLELPERTVLQAAGWT